MRVHADANAAARLSSSELWLPLAVFFACVLASLHASIAVPFPVPADAPATVFSEDRARGFLTGLLALGPFRTVGSRANEVLAPKFIEDAVADIKAASPGARIETQRHVGSGNFSLDFLGGFHNVYHDVQNVLVLVRGQQPPEAGVLMISEGDRNTRSILDVLTVDGRRLAMVQAYVPAVREGDKRILLLEGKPLGAINRVPRPDDLRSNIHVGGRVDPVDITPAEHAMIADIAPRLVEDGLWFVGLDVIGGKLTEVNVTSPTGIQEMSLHHGRDLAVDVIEWIERRTNDYRPRLRSIPA